MANWIKGAIRHPGSFRKAAQEHGESTAEFASEVKRNPKRFSSTTRRRAALAQTLRGMRKSKRS